MFFTRSVCVCVCFFPKKTSEMSKKISKKDLKKQEQFEEGLRNPVHKIVTQHICLECGEGFERKGNLKRHKDVHEGPLRCDWCGTNLSSKATLKQHLKTCVQKRKKKKYVNPPSPSTPPLPPPPGPMPSMPILV